MAPRSISELFGFCQSMYSWLMAWIPTGLTNMFNSFTAPSNWSRVSFTFSYKTGSRFWTDWKSAPLLFFFIHPVTWSTIGLFRIQKCQIRAISEAIFVRDWKNTKTPLIESLFAEVNNLYFSLFWKSLCREALLLIATSPSSWKWKSIYPSLMNLLEWSICKPYLVFQYVWQVVNVEEMPFVFVDSEKDLCSLEVLSGQSPCRRICEEVTVENRRERDSHHPRHDTVPLLGDQGDPLGNRTKALRCLAHGFIRLKNCRIEAIGIYYSPELIVKQGPYELSSNSFRPSFTSSISFSFISKSSITT